MKRNGILFLLVAIVSLPFLKADGQQKELPRPKLVVGIVVDQMRWDYLYRYYDRYEAGGFKRMLNEGFSCENAFINYLPSYTAVGHTIVYTGSVPAVTGIVGNDWTNQLTGERFYCTEDHEVQTVGATGDVGEMSPKRMLVSTVTDELRLATNFRSRVVGVSLKDRAAILPAGHTANAAFWMDDASGHFVTSSYYMDELPQWVQQFNAQNLPEQLVENGWETLYPIETYVQSSEDNVSWEGRFRDEEATTFPHDMKNIYAKSHGSLRSTPFGNTLTLAFAQAAVNGYKLGQGEVTDFLTVNCASTDYVGHMYGPNSIEVEDTYLRLDKQLAAFFSFLDKQVGKGEYLVFLTADHGGAHSIGFMQEHDLPADFLEMKTIQEPLEELLAEKFGAGDLVKSLMNYQVNYDMTKIREQHLDYEAIKAETVTFLKQQEGVQFAVDMDHIGDASIPEPLKSKIVNGYNHKRCGPVMIIPNPGWFSGHKGGTGTTHGTWGAYDTHLPLLFMGWGIKQGASNRHVRLSDIAPTVAALLHIQMGNGNVGVPIQEVMAD